MILKRDNIERIRSAAGDSRIKQEVAALALTFVPHEGNHLFAKVIALVLVITWLGMFAGYIPVAVGLSGWFPGFTAVVFAIVGRLWGISLKTVFGDKTEAKPPE